MTESATETFAPPTPRRITWAAVALVAAVVALAYYNSLPVPLLFDDARSIAGNPSIRDLSRLGDVLTPPANVFTAGRPFLNLTFAVNHAIGGTAVLGYHVGNLILHALAALTLFGLTRRLLLRPRFQPQFAADSAAPAMAIALVWAAHPLATNAVTYLSQRAESLMALCALVTLYGFVRGATSPSPRRWYAAAVSACALGMATKEVMVTVPLLVVLTDRTFFAGSFGGALRVRLRFYAALAATWLLLGGLIATSHLAQRDVGFHGNYTAWSYLLTECPIVVRYLTLAVWPYPLVFDYGAEFPSPIAANLLVPAVVLAALLVASAIGVRRNSVAGFVGACFFILLAPTSSFVPVQEQPMAESRMYLPLAVIAAGGVSVAQRVLGRRSWVPVGLIAAAFVVATVARNRTYQSELSLWQDTASKRPESSRAHDTLAALLLESPAKLPLAIVHAEAALRIKPDFAHAHYNLAVARSRQPERRADALAHFETALRLQPNYPEAHHNLAALLAQEPPRVVDAIAHYEQALRLRPDFAAAHNNLAGLLAADLARHAEAIRHYAAALAADPQLAEAHYNLANLLATDASRTAERIRHYEAALRLRPNLVGALLNLGALLAEVPGRESDAVGYFERALVIAPNNAAAHFNLATTLLRLPNRQADAIAHYREALRLRPDLEPAREMLRQLSAPTAP